MGPVHAIVAMHTGTAIVGDVGRAERTDYGVFGSAVNVASRLEGEGKQLGLGTVLSGSTVSALVAPADSLRLVTRKTLRGLSDRVEIWSNDPIGPSVSIGPRAATVVSTDEEDRSSPVRGLGWRPFATAALVEGVFLTAFLAVVGLGLGGSRFDDAITNVAQSVAAVAAAAVCAWAAGRTQGRVRTAWALIAGSATAFGIGQASGGVRQIGLTSGPTAFFTDAAFLAALALGIAGALRFWDSPRGATSRSRAVLDGLIVFCALTFAAWAFGLRQVYLWPGESLLEQATEVAIPVGEIVLATVVIMVINRGTRQQLGSLLLLLTSVGLSAVASVLGAYGADASGPYQRIGDAGLLVALGLVALAALYRVRSSAGVGEGSVDIWQLALPWMAVMLAAISTFGLVLQGYGLDRFLTLLSAILGALLAVSQVLAHKSSLSLLVQSRLAERTLADVIAHAPVGIARAGADMKIIDANPSLGVLLREPPEVVAGSAMAKYLPTDIQPQVRQQLGELANGVTEVIESEVPMIRADGSRAWVHLTSTAVAKASGRLGYFLTMLQDVTDSHEREQNTRANLAELEHLNQLKTDFLHSIGHEFKTALIGIQGFSELIRDAQQIDVKEVKEFAGRIHDGAERLDQMVTEFLGLDQVQAARADVILESVDLNAIIRRELALAKERTDGLVFVTDLEPDLSSVTGDGGQISEVVSTMLRNAVRYSPDGGQISVATRTHAGQVEVSVRDQGQGVRAEFDNPIFGSDDLYANNPIRRVIGTGLGLGIARQIVALHGGRIWIDHLDGIGSEVHVAFPIEVTHPSTRGSTRTDGRVAR